VIDGVTVGHPCCAVHNCHLPLENNRHRFCRTHQGQEAVCAVIGCFEPARLSQKTCKRADHEKVEVVHNDRGQARFQLQERLRRARVTHPNDALGVEAADARDLVDGEDVVEAFDLVPDGRALPAEESRCPKIRTQFGCRHTHNEQIIVAPCGMIIARETFYGAEAVSTVVVSCFLYYLQLMLEHF